MSYVRGVHFRDDPSRPLHSTSQTISAALFAIALVGGVFAALASGQFAAIGFSVTLGALAILFVIALLRGGRGSSAGGNVYQPLGYESPMQGYRPLGYRPPIYPSHSQGPLTARTASRVSPTSGFTPGRSSFSSSSFGGTSSSHSQRPLTARAASSVSPTSGFTPGHF